MVAAERVLPRPRLRQLPGDPARRLGRPGDDGLPRRRRQQPRAPNENYARELMELFSLGVGNYTETGRARSGARLHRLERAEEPHRPERVRAGRAGLPAPALRQRQQDLPRQDGQLQARRHRRHHRASPRLRATSSDASSLTSSRRMQPTPTWRRSSTSTTRTAATSAPSSTPCCARTSSTRRGVSIAGQEPDRVRHRRREGAGPDAGRCAALAHRRVAARRRRFPRRDGPDPVRAAERRRLAGRRRLAEQRDDLRAPQLPQSR